jgi:Ca2+-transporting ATPase
MNCPNAKDFKFAVDILNLNSTLTPQLVELLDASIAINLTTLRT